MKINKLALIMTVILLIQSVFIVNGATDSSILSETVSNTYVSRDIGRAVINNIAFTDMVSHWAMEPVSRLGALEIVKGVTGGAYRPNGTVTKEQALTLLVRVLGMEQEAIQAAQTIEQQNPSNDSLSTIWSKGYLQIAANIGLITNANLTDALADQTTLDPAINFIRTDAVTREQIAKWIVDAINVINPGQISPVYNQQQIFNYSDWQDMGVDYTSYIEAVIRAQIMVGSSGAFNPKGSVTRAEMAQIIKNIDNILYSTMNVDRKGGTVGAIYDSSVVNTLTGTTTRIYLIRNNDGSVDQFNYEYIKNALDQTSTKDTPVYKGGTLQGMMSLEEGDSVEYIVNQSTNELLYINDKGSSAKNEITGTLQLLTNISGGEITIKTDSDDLYTYKMRSALYDNTNQTIQIGDKTYPISSAPIGYLVTLTVQNAIVTDIAYKGNQVIEEEIGGIVKAINPNFSYITIIDWNGNEVTKYFNKNEVEVEKQNYYDTGDDIGYIDEMFPDYRFDQRDSSVDMIEPGDVVYLKIDVTDSDYVSMISAKTNYVVKYGTIKSLFSDEGADGLSAVITYDDGSVDSYDISSDIPVLKSDKNVGIGELVAGDVVRMLVNQAVIMPGTIKETIKEIIIDEYGNKVANIYKGQLGKFSPVQRELSFSNVYRLTNLGWKDYVVAKSLDITNPNICYYEDNKQVSLEYAQKYLMSSDIDAYVVTSEYYGSEKVEKVAFRSGRDSVLDFTNVTYSNGMDKINLLSQSDDISLDDGTIVIKSGKLVEVGSVISPDYAQVILNGNNKAAIVNIQTEPNNDAITVMRGRIESIEDGQSFTVQSNALLMDMSWVYSPVSRVYSLTKDTIIYDDEGSKISFEEFIDYSDISKVDEVYTIISEGTNAKYIVQNPYSKEGVKGQIYEVGSDNLMIKDVLVYSSDDKKWSELSLTNSYGQINILGNSVIIKNNKVITANDLAVGDKIRVMTTENMSDKLANESARDVDGYIIFVEK